jgi:site-specific recombinase XerD
MSDKSDNLDRFFAAHTWSDNTIDHYRRALLLFLQEVENPAELDAAVFLNWLESHKWGSSAQWIASHAVKAWVRWNYGENHPALALKLHREEAPPQRTLKLGQVRRLLESFDARRPKGRRDLAICTLFLDTGLRAAEVCSLKLRYLDLEERTLQVVIKGGRWASAVYSPYTASCIASWLADRASIAQPGTRAVFVGIGGNTPGQRMTRHGLKLVVKQWGKNAKIGKLSPHDFRRTFATLATRAGAPQRVAMAAGRWKDERVFMRYTQAIEPADIDPYSPVMQAVNGD